MDKQAFDWLTLQSPGLSNDPRLAHLDEGEREALSLAIELNADLLLIDDRDARSAAEACGLAVAGTLRVLASAAEKKLLDLPAAFDRLKKTSFRAHPKLYQLVLERHAAREESR